MDADTAHTLFATAPEADGTLISLREWNLCEIARDQHDKATLLITRDLLHKARAVLRTHTGVRKFSVSVSSLDPAFANLTLWGRSNAVARAIQAELPEIQVECRYDYCWYGTSSGSLFCCSPRRPRHRLTAIITIA